MDTLGIGAFIVAVLVAISFAGCNSSNLDYVKARGPDKWKEIGYEVIGYEGYQRCGSMFGTDYGGACVWWQLKAIPDNGIHYTGYLQRWGNELHVYGPIAVDAIKP